jgi:uncharacterized paraquat-inducible protein A
MQQSTPQNGVPCPECSFVIPTTMPMLLAGTPIVCPMCALVLHVDREKSADSLKLIQQLYETTQKVEETRTQWT